jgi:hypothetical protein
MQITDIISIIFYAPEAHITYLTISSSFLISFVMGESGPSRVIKFLYSPGPPPPHSMGPRPP